MKTKARSILLAALAVPDARVIEEKSRTKKKQYSAVALLLLGAVSVANADNVLGPGYTLTDLGPGIAYGINDAGQVVGDAFGVANVSTATVWNGGVATPLAALPGASETVATGINQAGQVVGYSYYGSSGVSQAVIWNGITPTALDNPPGASSSQANAINSSGQVAGYGPSPGTPAFPIVWNGTVPTLLGASAGLTGASGAFGINNTGQVVGINGGVATIWNGTTPTALGTLPSSRGDSVAHAINNKGQAVGNSTSASGDIATLWNGTTPTALGTLPGMQSSLVESINDAGVIVGYATAAPGAIGPGSLAVIWNGTTPTALKLT